MMRCNEVLRILDNHLDGALSGELSTRITTHLEGCGSCRRAEAATRALLARAAALPAAVEPARDLWPGIAGRLGEPVVVRRWRHWLPLAAAAALLVTATAAITVWRVGPGRTAATIEPGTPVVAAGLRDDAALAGAIGDCRRAAASLRAVLAQRRQAIAPATLRVIDANLAVVDGAISELDRALAAHPSNRGLEVLLAATYQRQIDLLETANSLPRT
jgi:predicted anti-sigma-YlaC factor YlaD